MRHHTLQVLTDLDAEATIVCRDDIRADDLMSGNSRLETRTAQPIEIKFFRSALLRQVLEFLGGPLRDSTQRLVALKSRFAEDGGFSRFLQC